MTAQQLIDADLNVFDWLTVVDKDDSDKWYHGQYRSFIEKEDLVEFELFTTLQPGLMVYEHQKTIMTCEPKQIIDVNQKLALCLMYKAEVAK